MIEFIIENWDQIIVSALATVGAASAIAALTPTKADDEFFAKLYKVVNYIALNFKKGDVKSAVTTEVKKEEVKSVETK